MNLDSHQHFWRYDAQQYTWMRPEQGILRRDYLPPDLEPLLQAAGFEGTIVVQARQTLEETRWLLELADQYPLIKGVVGWVDLQSPSLHDDLARFAKQPRLRGVRHLLQDEADDEFALRPAFQNGIRALAEFDLTYDICIYERQLPEALSLVYHFPDQPFILDHIAKPRIKARYFEPWASNLRRLAGFPNVVCKVSGLVTEADWQAWTPSDLTAYLDVVFDCFGPRRLMIGSDWPVCTLAAPYAQTMAIVTDYIKDLSPHEQQMVLGGTARMAYRV